MSSRILLADDQRDVLIALELLLKSEGFTTRSVLSTEGVLDALREEDFDGLLMDLNYTRDTTSGEEGLDLLRQLAAMPRAPVVIVMTAWGTMELAVEAMRHGARDFVLKPWDNDALVASLRQNLRSQPRERYSRNELEVAASVQRKLWPQGGRELPGLEVSGYSLPVGAVGGDTYDFIEMEEDRLAFALADVSGKGLPAALLMASLQAILRSGVRQSAGDLASFLEAANRHFYESSELNRYATLFFAVYEDGARLLSYVSCGHPAALLLRPEGALERLPATSAAFGMFDDMNIEVREQRLEPEDRLVIYSDGVVEAETEDGDELGEERFVDLARELGGTFPDVAERLVTTVSRRYPRQTDDMTVVVARAR